jgi:hypothetical protein
LAKNQRTTPNLHKEEKWHKAKPKSNPNYCCAEGGTLTFSSSGVVEEELHERGGSSGEKKRSQMSFSKKKGVSNTLYTKLNNNDKSVDLSIHIFKYPNLSGFLIFM